ncbi:glycoside hydrolase family 2 protein [Caldibacillus lycopersici]|uniref:Glycoside hydrolase family 2 protein n=1 Tax=Perspicuibacillus lycopersici TaxID=1325689 RepID=A0AAE3IUR9_9BACI|nr:glycoside hydrolase family 2 protein [Perspicuibacillus lycopersici]MCU9614896.1 glycoside hydrolase family 2 protein [Perspicuibacillus lycopersici]
MKNYKLSNWLFYLGDDSLAWQKDYDDASWQAVTVPHDWSISQPFSKTNSSGTGYLPGGIGWYRCHIPLIQFPITDDPVVQLTFDGVYKNAQVWVNGYNQGIRPSGYSSFTIDLTEILQYAPDRDLVIAVRVDHTDIADSRWYNGSGITRNVWLEIHDPIFIKKYGTVFSTVEHNGDTSDICIQHMITNTFPTANDVTIVNELASMNGKQTFHFERKMILHPHEKATFSFHESVKNPKLWSTNEPNVYMLTTTLFYEVNGHTFQTTYTNHVGIRTVHFDVNTGFFLNNEQMKLKGVCLHEDAGCFGTAVPVTVWLRRLLKLKEMGCNAIRMAHNPHAPELYTLCDVLGFLVIDEAFDEWENPKNKWWQGHNVYPPKLEGYAHHFPNWYATDLKNMIERNRNHPSIIAWSIGNETDYPNDPYANPLFAEMTGNNDANKPAEERIYNANRPNTRRLTSIANQLINIVKSIDVSRPVTLAAAFPELSSQTGLLTNLDLIGYNYKEHLYEEHHQRFPNQPIIGSENGHGYSQWKMVRDTEYISGQFLWTGIDYLGEARGWPIHGSSAGLLDLAGNEKTRYFLRKSWWTEEPMVYLVTRPLETSTNHPLHWKELSRKWDYCIGEKVEVICFSNCDRVEIEQNGEKTSVSFDETFGYFVATIQATDSPIKAFGYKDAVVVTDELSTVLYPAQVKFTIWDIPEELLAILTTFFPNTDQDVVQITLSLLDRNGKLCDISQNVSISIQNGKLLGLENGRLDDVTDYSEAFRSTNHGNLMIYLQKSKDLKTQIQVETNGVKSTLLTL